MTRMLRIFQIFSILTITLYNIANGQSTISIQSSPSIQLQDATSIAPTPSVAQTVKSTISIDSLKTTTTTTEPTTTTTANPTTTTANPTTTTTNPTTTTANPTTTTKNPPTSKADKTTSTTKTTTTSTKQPTVSMTPKPSSRHHISSLTFQVTSGNSSCSGHGYLLQSVEDPSRFLCSCFEDYHGENCENDVDKIMEKLVFGLAILAGILLIASFFTGCQWHARLGILEAKESDIKELSNEKEKLKKQITDLKRRSPSPGRPPRSPRSNYAPSVVGSPNLGFYEDDRRTSVFQENMMPSYDDRRLSAQQLPNGDVILRMIEEDSTDDELDGIEEKRKEGKRVNADAMSVNSVSTVGSNTNSDMILLGDKRDKRRRPVSQEIPLSDAQLVINHRGYVARGRSRSPSPVPQQELNVDNLRQFDNGNLGISQEQRKARSMSDLRVIAMTGQYQDENGGGNLYKPRSIENILTGQVHKLAPVPNSNGSVSSESKHHGRGIYARQKQREMEDSSF